MRPAAEEPESGTPVAIKEPPMEIDGRVMSAEEFVRYVENLEFEAPLPKQIFLHHTWKPTRETWNGKATILGMKAYYERQLWRDEQGRLHEGWNAGPHLFIADDGIWLFSDLRYDGVGVAGHNTGTRHIEMVGDYDNQLPSGATLSNTIAALGVLHERLGLDIQSLGFHRDLSTKSCPGRAVRKDWIIPQVAAWLEAYRQARGGSPLREMLAGLAPVEWVAPNSQAALSQAAKARGLLGAVSQEIPIEIDEQAYVVQFFVEALLVPANRWDQVQSLSEYESNPHGAELALTEGADGPRPVVAPPYDVAAPWVAADRD